MPKKPATIIDKLKHFLAFLCRSFRGEQRPKADCCPCPPALKQPDPFIYSQYYLMGLGLPVTWDNPDIYIYDGSVLVDPHNLKAATTYTVAARIWNNSTDVPVVNLKVSFSYLSFGMGTQSNPIGDTTVDLGVKGLPGCPAFAYMPWTTPATVGHYCLQVLLTPPSDSNWLNNLGQRNTDVTQPHSPAVFNFAVGNHKRAGMSIVRFTMDAYEIPSLPLCNERVATRSPRIISKTALPIPAGWTVVLIPNELQLNLGEEKQVEAQITPPPGFSGSQPINITAWDGAGVIGGVTLTVEVP